MKRLAALAAGISIGVVGLAEARPFAHTAVPKPRPTLTASGTHLHWTAIEGATSYQVIARPAKVRVTVTGTEADAPRFPGVAEKYAVRAYMPARSPESNKVTVDWAAIEAAERTKVEQEAREAKEAAERLEKELRERENRENEERVAKEAEKRQLEREAAEKAQHEREAREKAETEAHERELREKAELEAKQHKEAEERAAKEAAEREAREKAEREAKEAAERAQKEREQREAEEREKAKGSCTTTVSTTAAISGAISKGGTVCLTAGTYGSINLSTTPSAQVTVTAVPGAHVNTGGINIAASNLTVSQLHVTGSINIASGNNNVIEHNEVSGGGYGISILAPIASPAKNTTIAWNRIHDTSHTSEGDALRFDGWENVQVIGNDIYNIAECPAHNCHTDTLQSYQAGTATQGLLINHNYVHDDTAVQGLPFLKDGDVQNVTITDNLEVRDSSAEQVAGFWVDENTKALLIEHNTYLAGSVIKAEGSAPSPSAKVEHNVLQEFNTGGGYALTEDYNIYTGNNQWSFTLGPHSTKGTPAFANASVDDYRVSGGAGVDWAPAEYVYGPTW